MADQFTKVIERVLAHEGGYTWHPKDPGGETNWGIAKRSYPNGWAFSASPPSL